jgi:hypothetical protein
MGDMDQLVHVVGGGTVDRVRQNLAVASVSYGETARRVAALCRSAWADAPGASVEVHLTRMACGGESSIETVADVRALLKRLVQAESTRAIFLPAALCPFEGGLLERSVPVGGAPDSGTVSPRGGQQLMVLAPREEVVDYVRAYRKEIFLVGFATAAGLQDEELAAAAQEYAASHSCSLVVAKDRVRRRWALSGDGRAPLVSGDRDEVLGEAVARARAAVRAVTSRPPQAQAEERSEAHP